MSSKINSSQAPFPHENKAADAKDFCSSVFKDTAYESAYKQDFIEYLKKYGIKAEIIK